MRVARRNPLDEVTGAGEIRLADVEQHEHRLLGQEAKAADRLLLVRLELDVANRAFGFEALLQLPDDDLLALVRLALRGRAVTPAPAEPLDPPVDEGQVRERELEVELIEVPARIDGSRRVW